MTPAEFRAALEGMNISQSGFARALVGLGDERPWRTVLRSVQLAAGHHRQGDVPWSVAALVRLMQRSEAWRPLAWRVWEEQGRPSAQLDEEMTASE